jgi:F-type H+-transporting ATPase subunit b
VEAILPPLGELIPATIGFLILFGVMWKFAFPTITKALDERATTIRESLEKAEETRMTAERLLEEYKVQMAEARQEANKVITESRRVGEQMKEEIVAKAHSEAEAMIEKARISIEQEKKAAVAELQGSVATLSVSIAGKIIGEKLDPASHATLITRSIEEAGGFNAN